ncbi:hypothetical protein [Thiomicrorhabdus arctica]|uniref:hypothetical protein n=1 Tax=Thiomicrorhabdus arctica TaxID=131540 RepID=UPI00037A4C99|nr:hypothetical protein [Thiomicrorhabdus arctica]
MSDLNTEKDDIATQEMLDMMGELPEDQAEIPDDLTDIDMDDLLNSLDEFESEADNSIEVATTPADDTSAIDLEDIDSLMGEVESDHDMEIDVNDTPNNTPPETQNAILADTLATEDETEQMENIDEKADISSNQASKDIDLDGIEDIDTVMEQIDSTHSSESSDITDKTPEATTEPSNEVSDEIAHATNDEMTDLDEVGDIDEMMAELDLPAEAEPTDHSNVIDEDATPTDLPEEEAADTPEEVSPETIETDNLDDLMSQAETVEEMDTGIETLAEEGSNEIPIDESIDMSMETELSTDEPDAEPLDNASSEANEPDKVDSSTLDVVEDEVTSDESADNTPHTDFEANVDNPIIEQSSQSVASMEDAIEIDQEIQGIASLVQNTAQEATLLALATSKKAHESAEKIQQAIEATFVATERAFEAAKNAGYTVELSELETQLSSPEIAKRLLEIQAKNKTLKAVNESLKARISDLND